MTFKAMFSWGGLTLLCASLVATAYAGGLVRVHDAFNDCEIRIGNTKDLDALEKEADYVEKVWGNQEDLRPYAYLKCAIFGAMQDRASKVDPFSAAQDRIDREIWRTLQKIDTLPLTRETFILVTGPGFYEEAREEPLSEKVYAERRTRAMGCVFRLWSRLEKATDPKYVDADDNKPAKEPPPEPPAGARDGHHATEWAAYDTRIAQSQAKAEWRSEQHQLYCLRTEELPGIEKWVINAYNHKPFNPKELEAFLTTYIQDPLVRARITAAVPQESPATTATKPAEKADRQ